MQHNGRVRTMQVLMTGARNSRRDAIRRTGDVLR